MLSERRGSTAAFARRRAGSRTTVRAIAATLVLWTAALGSAGQPAAAAGNVLKKDVAVEVPGVADGAMKVIVHKEGPPTVTGRVTVNAGLLGISCTIESLESGHCESV